VQIPIVSATDLDSTLQKVKTVMDPLKSSLVPWWMIRLISLTVWMSLDFLARETVRKV